MLVPYVGEAWALAIGIAMWIAGFAAFAWLAHWQRQPYRDLVDHIRQRQHGTSVAHPDVAPVVHEPPTAPMVEWRKVGESWS